MTYIEFHTIYINELKIKPDYIRPGQLLMNLLSEYYYNEYYRITYFDKEYDCFHIDSKIPDILEHLKKCWVIWPS